MITSEEIKSRLWEGANDLRGLMDASKYKKWFVSEDELHSSACGIW